MCKRVRWLQDGGVGGQSSASLDIVESMQLKAELQMKMIPS